MKKRTRAMRRWGERVARWGLTLLLVALVGVMVASGWWRLLCSIGVPRDEEASFEFVYVELHRGTVVWHSVDLGRIGFESGGIEFELPRSFDVTIDQPPDYSRELAIQLGRRIQPKRSRFEVWGFGPYLLGWRISLIYPMLAVALPTLFLWYRRIRRRCGRGLCARCGYDLAGLAAVGERIVCPECGAANAAGRGGGGATVVEAGAS